MSPCVKNTGPRFRDGRDVCSRPDVGKERRAQRALPKGRWRGLPLRASAFLVAALAWSTALGVAAPPPDRGQPPDKRAPLELREEPAPFVAEKPRSEHEKERLEAVARFASGRMLERLGRSKEALRHYQRAFRQDPQAIQVGRAIVPLAYELERHAVAVRYAIKVVAMENADPMLLRQLGVYLTRQGDFAGAVKLYEQAAAASDTSQPTAADVLLRMEMGRLYHLIEDYPKAADSFTRVLDALKDPKKFGLDDNLQTILLGEAGSTYNLMGECFLQAGHRDQAAATFRQAHREAPNQGVLDFHLAQVAASKGQPKQALEKLLDCFRHKIDSEDTAPYELLAEVLDDLGRKEELISRLEKLQSSDPGNIPLGYYLAERYLAEDKLEKAELLYLVLTEKKATTAGYQGLAQIYRRTERPERLLETLGEAAAITGGLEAFGSQVEKITGSPEVVDALLDMASRRAQKKPDKLTYGMRYAAALVAMESARFDAARDMFELSLEAEPDRAAELLTAWGVGLLLADRPAEAAKVFQRGIDDNLAADDAPVLYYYLSAALSLDNETDAALAAARKAAEAKPDSVRYVSRVAWVLYLGERHDDARRAYEALVDRFDDEHNSEEVRQVLREARLVLSNLCVIQDDLAAAEEWLEQVLDEFPDDPGAANDLGYLWADQNRHLERALAMIERAAAAEPDNLAFRDSLGWVYHRLGRHAEAVAELEKAAAGDEPDGVILDHLGEAHRAAGNQHKAHDAWRRAAEAFHQAKQDEKAKAVEQKIHENP